MKITVKNKVILSLSKTLRKIKSLNLNYIDKSEKNPFSSIICSTTWSISRNKASKASHNQ